jgi:hypothetical protein
MQMKRNVGTIDRLIRLVLAIVFIIADVMDWVMGITGLVLALVAGMLLSGVASGYSGGCGLSQMITWKVLSG